MQVVDVPDAKESVSQELAPFSRFVGSGPETDKRPFAAIQRRSASRQDCKLRLLNNFSVLHTVKKSDLRVSGQL